MSNRFYVNNVQIFGNNEMFQNTYDELKKQGAEWTEDGTFGEIEIKDPQALMDAVETDSLEYLKNCFMKGKCFDEKKKKLVKRRWCGIHDKDLVLDDFDSLKNRAYSNDGEVRKNAWQHLKWWVSEKRLFTSLNLYFVIQNEVEFSDSLNKLVLKKNGKIIACMY